MTTLEIGSLAVAIALQDTLGNLFAGLYIKSRPPAAGRPFRKTFDRKKVTWSASAGVTRRNSKLVQNNIVNFHTGDTDSTILVQLWVHYNNDLEKVEQVTSAVAREVRQASAIATRTAIRVYTFLILNSFGVDFAVTLSAED